MCLMKYKVCIYVLKDVFFFFFFFLPNLSEQFFGLPPKAFLSDLMVAGKSFCEEDCSRLKRKHSSLHEEDLHHYCFSSTYILALLHDSLGIGLDDDSTYTERVFKTGAMRRGILLVRFAISNTSLVTLFLRELWLRRQLLILGEDGKSLVLLWIYMILVSWQLQRLNINSWKLNMRITILQMQVARHSADPLL
ncbi:uncharacterized protein LOC107847334 [Capsicum annuum]|uniref:uncharacterized protein LOC107847334 n=1 Tax=Capsicum annuum TaxID=4072 RepID=UPI001FB08257|nr:uncharacterized protein LOC107847334 [Capsicum annuum]